MLTVATCLWQANGASLDFSRVYSPMWVERLAAGFRRNLSLPHRFVVFTDQDYDFSDGIEQRRLEALPASYGSMIEPFKIDGPLIVTGLDTVVTGNLDHMAAWCRAGAEIALPKSPGKDYACNGVVLVPPGHRGIWERWGGQNDMDWLRLQDHIFIDDLWPGQVASFKCDVRPNGLRQARMVYMHGWPKMDALEDLPWVRKHWVA